MGELADDGTVGIVLPVIGVVDDKAAGIGGISGISPFVSVKTRGGEAVGDVGGSGGVDVEFVVNGVELVPSSSVAGGREEDDEIFELLAKVGNFGKKPEIGVRSEIGEVDGVAVTFSGDIFTGIDGAGGFFFDAGHTREISGVFFTGDGVRRVDGSGIEFTTARSTNRNSASAGI